MDRKKDVCLEMDQRMGLCSPSRYGSSYCWGIWKKPWAVDTRTCLICLGSPWYVRELAEVIGRSDDRDKC